MSNDLLRKICIEKLQEKGLYENKEYRQRLKWELEEVFAKEKVEYFLNLYKNKIRYPYNQNNLILCWLLGICQDYDITKQPVCKTTGDNPDVDIDYLSKVRDYIKNEWSIKTFGEDYVCNIGNYTTYGIKSALIDMVRVHNGSREEILNITKNLDNKDEDGAVLTWDAAMRLHPELKAYCDKNPEIAKAAQKLVGRNRGMGVHAGGLIISRMPINELVPLVKRKDSPQASAWVEGLHGQDLQPVGLVKFDLLVISNLMQIALCCDLVKKRHNLDGICNKPNEPDWTDVNSWRNDKASLETANRGDLKCVFQFDSEGIRELVKKGGVDKFEDLVAYTALFRPGPLNCGMTKAYVERKKGREDYVLHPKLEPFLGKTYGVMVYQEQVMQVLNVVGDIPLTHCENIRKAISKKKIDQILSYKNQFITNGQKNLNYTLEQMQEFFGQIETWSEYGFNLSHSMAYTYISGYMLYLKTHYPHEFYTSILMCETLSDKIKDYKMEARMHGVEIEPIDINKSAENFALVDDKIYFGFSKIKGLGEEPAKRIVAGQPYKGFEDFLTRFGTDITVIKRLVGLRVFKERDPITLYKFAEHFSEFAKKIEDRKKRYKASMEKYELEFKRLLPYESRSLADLDDGSANPFESPEWKEKYDQDEIIFIDKDIPCHKDDENAIEKVVSKKIELEEDALEIERQVSKYYKKGKVKRQYNLWQELRKLWQRRLQAIKRSEQGELIKLPTLAEFEPDEYEIDTKTVKEIADLDTCELLYYGFPWIHALEKSPDYKGNFTFERLKSSNDSVGPVEIYVKKVNKKTAKTGSTYYQIVAEDAKSYEAKINVWEDDWEVWHEEFVEGNLLRVRLQPPSGGFPTFLMESNQLGKWRGRKKYSTKINDPRVIVLRKANVEKIEHLTDDDIMDIL